MTLDTSRRHAGHQVRNPTENHLKHDKHYKAVTISFNFAGPNINTNIEVTCEIPLLPDHIFRCSMCSQSKGFTAMNASCRLITLLERGFGTELN